MNNFKRISFILATKNRGKYLEKAFAYIKKIKTPVDELIIIDGLSKDNTKEIIQRFRRFVDIFVSEEDISEGHALNKGILASSGKFIKVITDDDVIYHEGVEEAIRILNKYPEIDVLLCGGTRLIRNQVKMFYIPRGVNYGRRVSDVFTYGGCGIGMIIRKAAFAKIGLFNAHAVALDLDFITQTISNGANVKFCRIKLFHHPILPHSGTVRRIKEWQGDVQRIKRRYGLDKDISIRFADMTHFLKKKFLVGEKKEEYIWDAGFS